MKLDIFYKNKTGKKYKNMEARKRNTTNESTKKSKKKI